MTTIVLNKVAGYRAMLGYNQTEFAEMLNMSKQTYGRKENGISPFKDNEKIMIKEIFSQHIDNITYEELFF